MKRDELVVTTIRLPRGEREQLAALAEREGRTVASEIRLLVKARLRRGVRS